MVVRPVVLALLTATALVATAGCADDPTPAEDEAAAIGDLTSDLVAETDGALDEEAAACVAERLVDSLGPEGLDQLAEAAGNPDETDPLRDEVIDAFAQCDALEAILETSAPSDVSDDTGSSQYRPG